MPEVVGEPEVFDPSGVDQGQHPLRVDPGEQFEGPDSGGVVPFAQDPIGIRGDHLPGQAPAR